MTLTIELSADVERRLTATAAAAGTNPERLAADYVAARVGPQPDERTFAEICAPFAKAFAESGMTEDELDDLVEEARNEIWEEKHGPAWREANKDLPPNAIRICSPLPLVEGLGEGLR